MVDLTIGTFISFPTFNILLFYYISGLMSLLGAISFFCYPWFKKEILSEKSKVKVLLLKKLFFTNLILFISGLLLLLLNFFDFQLDFLNYNLINNVQRKPHIFILGLFGISFLISLFLYIKALNIRGFFFEHSCKRTSLIVFILMIIFFFPLSLFGSIFIFHHWSTSILISRVTFLVVPPILIISSWLLKRIDLSQILRWCALFFFLSSIMIFLYQFLIGRLFLPSSIRYCNKVIEIVEEINKENGKYPEKLPLEIPELINRPFLIAYPEYLYCKNKDNSYTLDLFLDSRSFLTFNSKEKKWNYCIPNLWY